MASGHGFAVYKITNIPYREAIRTLRPLRTPDAPRQLLCTITAALALGLSVAASALDFASLQDQLIARFGPARITLLKDWQALLEATRSLPEADKFRRVNDFFNRNIGFDEDITIWNQSDYWATPLETIGRGRGDCEDFSIVKYYTLRQAGVPVSKMRLIYVKASQGGKQRAHMVLAYYPSPNAEPLVLDNLVPEILPASQRRDLQPVFSFNSEAIWNGVAGNAARGAGGTGQLSRWQDLLLRARKEGFD